MAGGHNLTIPVRYDKLFVSYIRAFNKITSVHISSLTTEPDLESFHTGTVLLFKYLEGSRHVS